MSDDHALTVLRLRKRDCEGMILSSQAEISRLNFDLDEQKLVIQQKTSQLDDLNKAIEKLERA